MSYNRIKFTEEHNRIIHNLDLPTEIISALRRAQDLEILDTDEKALTNMLISLKTESGRQAFKSKLSEAEKDAPNIFARIENEVETGKRIMRSQAIKENFKKLYNSETTNDFKMKNFPFVDLIKSRDSKNFSNEWRDTFALGNEAMRDSGLGNIPVRDQYVIPIVSERAIWEANKTNVGTVPLYALPNAAGKTIFGDIASIFTGLLGNVTVPGPNNVIAGWVGQTAANQNGAGDLNNIPLNPLRLQAWFDVSKTVISMGGQAASDYCIQCLIDATAHKLEASILDPLPRSSVRPQGQFYKATTGNLTKKASVVPTFNDLLEMEAEVAALKALQGNLAYITSGKGKKILKSCKKETGYSESLLEKGFMNDYPVLVSNWLSDTVGSDGLGSGLVFGNWADLLICQFGAYLITIDSTSQALNNKVRIFVDSFWDVRGMRFPSASTGIGTDKDEYVGFSTLPIKL